MYRIYSLWLCVPESAKTSSDQLKKRIISMNLTLSICLLRLHSRSSIQLDREGIVFFEAPTNALCVIFECNQRTISNLNPLRRVNWYELTERSVGRWVYILKWSWSLLLFHIIYVQVQLHEMISLLIFQLNSPQYVDILEFVYLRNVRANRTKISLSSNAPHASFRFSQSLYAHIFNAFTVCTFQNPYRFECMHAFIIS